MGDLGLAGSFGAGGAADALETIMARRMMAQKYADFLKQQAVENAFKQQSLNQGDDLKRLALQQHADAQAGAQKDREIGLARNLNDAIPANTFLPQTDPAVGMLRTGGYGSSLTPQNAQESVGQEFVGPLQDSQTRGAAHPAGFLKTASAKQQSDASNQERKDWQASIQQQMADLKAGQSPPSSYQLQPEIDPKTGQQTGRFLGYNTKLNRWEPVQGNGPGATKPAPGAAQGAEHERSKKEAMGSLDQLDQAIDAAAPFLGPGQGRVSSIQELIGNPDPKISALGTKLLLTKMQVDHAATGTVRAGASPQLLARWDNLLSRNLEPQNLKASVQAMREILGGQAPASSAKPSAADLIKKYGG